MKQTLTPPEEVFAESALRLGSRVVNSVRLEGGYTPQQLYRLSLADGRSVVLKAAGPNETPETQPVWTDVLRREVTTYRGLRELAPWRPAFFGDFEVEGWVGLLIEDLSDALRVPPWTAAAIDRVARGLASMHAATITDAQPTVELRREALLFPTRIRERGRRLGGLPPRSDDEQFWRWLGDALDAVEALFASTQEDSPPYCFIHFDVRSDNMFLRDGSELVLIDWSSLSRRNPLLDSVYWSLGVEVEGGGRAARVHEKYLEHAPFFAQASSAQRGVEEALCFCAGYFVNALQAATAPAHVQAVRLRFLRPTLQWFAEALRLPPPPFHLLTP